MVFLKFVGLVAYVMFNISLAVGHNDIFFNKLREQASACEKGNTYEVKAGGCRSSCQCLAIGVMRCDENECKSNGDGIMTEKQDTLKSSSIFERLRDDATTCENGQEIDSNGCGKCVCVLTGILNCQLKAECLPTHGNKHRRQEVSNVIIG